jgi:hypothetical protein
MKIIEAKAQNITEQIKYNSTTGDNSSEKCSRELDEKFRFVFNSNPQVKKMFTNEIDRMLMEVFPDNYYQANQYGPGQLSGIYDLEKKGRSGLNFINTNYSCFCVLLNDVNKVLRSQSRPEIQILGVTPKEQIEQTKKFLNVIDEYKTRIFNPNSSTFNKIIKITSRTTGTGAKTEDDTIKVLKQIFKDENVVSVAEIGNDKDALKGVDCELTIYPKTYTAQIKPFGRSQYNEEDDTITIYNTANVKPYYTDLMIFSKFSNGGKNILIFDNQNTKIVDGNYVFNKKDRKFDIT